jgi:hypothetical protein
MQFPNHGLVYASFLVAFSASHLSAVTFTFPITDASAVIFFGNRTYDVDFTVSPNFRFSASNASGEEGSGFLQTNLIYDPENKIFFTNGALEISLSDLSLFCQFGCGSGNVGFVLNLKYGGGPFAPRQNVELSATGFGPANKVRGEIGSRVPVEGPPDWPPQSRAFRFSEVPIAPNSLFSFGPFTASNLSYLSEVQVSVIAELGNPPGTQPAGDFDVFSIPKDSFGFRAGVEPTTTLFGTSPNPSTPGLPILPNLPGLPTLPLEPAEVPEPASFFLAGSALLAGRFFLRR